jgi:WD40 repeat protein
MSGSKIASCAMDNTVKLWRIFSDNNKKKQEGGEGESKCGPIETAVRKSFTVVPDRWSGNNQSCQKFKTIFHQFPYFSTDEAHTNYVGKSIC